VVTVPAFVWRGGFFRRALIVGGSVGIALGALAWLDSGFLLSGVIVLVIVGVFYAEVATVFGRDLMPELDRGL
jgi:hypothetical protein